MFSRPNMCGWKITHEDNYDEEGPMEEWLVYEWYCQTRQTILHTYIYDIDSPNSKGDNRKYCLCNNKKDLAKVYLDIQKMEHNDTLPEIGQKNLTSSGLSQFNCWYMENKLIDYHLKAGEVEIGVHKMFLALISPMFNQLFDSEFKKVQDKYQIDEDPELVRMFVDFLYSGKLTDVSPEDKLGMLGMAQLLQLQGVDKWLIMFDLKPIKHDHANLLKYSQILLSSDLELAPYILAHQLEIHHIANLDWLDFSDPGIKKTKEYLEFLTYSV